MTFSKSWSEPRNGKNPGLVQRFAPSPDDVELTGGPLLAVPGAIPGQGESPRVVDVFHKPQRARRRQDQAQGIGSHHALDLTTLIVPKARQGIVVTDRDL